MNTLLKVGTTFSGMGATEQALKNLNIPHEVEWACDIDKFAKKTYFANHSCKVWYDDITKIDVNKLEYVDFYQFSFPCQDISVSGKQNLQNGKSILVRHSLDIIDIISPKYFMFENVTGLLSKKFESFYQEIMKRLNINYNTHVMKLNTKDFGIPQNRPRIFCVGIRKDLNQQYPKIVPNTIYNVRIYDSIPEKDMFLATNHKFNTMQGKSKRNYIQFDRSGKGYNSVSDRVYNKKSILPCLRAGGYNLPYIYDIIPSSISYQIRKLSIKEKLRLQGFPDTFNTPCSYTQTSKQLGNSMTVKVVEEVLKRLLCP